MNDLARLERLEDAIGRLREAAAGNAVVVEGPRDKAALEDLGVGGQHIVINQGASLVTVADRIVEQAGTAGWSVLILLMDWDRTGNTLQARFQETLAGRVPVDVGFRARLRRVSHTSSLEEVPADLAALRRRTGGRP